MSTLNFKHLRYFWMVAKTGSIARAAEQLHLTPQSISGQLSEFADTLGVELFRRSGRQLELTDTGRRILSHAESIFSTGDELLEIVRDQSRTATTTFRVGCADSVSKLIACRLVEPALRLAEPLRIICREGRLASLLADLAVHRLDLIMADRPMPAHLSVRGFNHLLGESGMTLFGTPALAATLSGGFPECLDGAPLLIPGAETVVRSRVQRWFAEQQIQPKIIGEFDDSALMQAFGQSGSGIFIAPSVIAEEVLRQYGVALVGQTDAVTESFYAISVERKVKHPGIVAITEGARRELFTALPT